MTGLTPLGFFKWNVLTNVLMAFSINTAATILAGGDTLAGWVTGCCCAFAINTVAAAILPMGRIGNWFSQEVCGRKPGTFGEMFFRNLIVNAIYVTIISFSVALIHVGISQGLGHTVSVWISTYFQLHLVGLITGLIIEKPVARVMEGH